MKEAGFPQPQIAVGQFWYSDAEYKGGEYEHNPLCLVVEQPVTRARYLLRRLTCEKMTGEHGSSPIFFAPTADQILVELPGSFRLGANVGERNGVKCVEYVAWDLTDDDFEMIAAYHKNAAEALALAWLDWKNKKTRAEQETPSGA